MFRNVRSAKGYTKIVSRKIKVDKRMVQVLGIGITLVLVLQLTGPFVPLPASFAIPPLPSTQPITSPKTHTANQLGTQVQTTVTFRAELNGTIIFSRDGTERFRIFAPRGLTGSTTLLTNETYAIVDVSSGSFYIQEKWKLNAQKFKMELCWNLPSATNVKLPLSRVDLSTNNVFLINGLDFDWKDAAQAGFSPVYSNQTKEIEVSVPATGCLDPLVGTSSVSPNNAILSPRNVQFFGNAWYVFYTDTSNYVFKCSYAGGAFGTATTIRALSSNTFMMNAEKNSTHIYIHTGINGGVWEKRVLTPTSTCGTTLDTASTILSTGRMGGGNIIQNSTGYLHTVGYDSADSGIALAISNNPYARGNLWTNKGIAIAHNAGYSRLGIINLTNSKFLIYDFYSGDSQTNAHLKTRIFYVSNNTYGTLITLESSLQKSDNNGDCIGSSSQNKAYCAVLLSDGRLRLWRFDGSSWTSEIVAYPSTNAAVGIVRNNADDTLVLFRTINGENIMKWNKTNSAGSSFASNGQFFVGVQTSPQMMSTSVKPNGTGYVGIAWVNGSSAPFNIHFTTFQAFNVTTWGTDIAVMNSANHEREPHIVASTKSNTLVAVGISGDGNGARCETRASTNGGDSWGNANTIPKNLTNSRQGDPAVATNSTGGFIMTCLELGNSGTSDSAKERIYTYSSKDGISWSFQKMIKSDDTTAILLDKPWVVIDSNSTAGHPYKDYVYVCWTQFHRDPVTEQNLYTQIMFKRILPTPLAEKVLFNATFTYGSQIGCNMAIGTNGEVYVPWFNYELGGPLNAMLQFRWNELGGDDWGWGRIQNVTSFKRSLKYHTDCLPNNKWDCLKGTGTSAIRIGFMPGLAVDMKGGVHLVYAENRTGGTNGQADIRYVNSDDCRRGSSVDRCSWNAPITINLDTTNRDQFMPTIHVSNITSPSAPRGTIYVTALDRRSDANNEDWEVWSYTCAPGATLGCRSASDWSNVVISDAPINNQGLNFVGDYNGIAHTKTKEAYPIWVDDRDFGTPNNKLFDIYGDWSKR